MVMKKVFWIILCMFFIPLVTFAGNMKLHYDRPAEYFEEALVIGNGTMGATLYGGVKKDFGQENPKVKILLPMLLMLFPKSELYWIMRIMKEQIRLNTRYKDITAKIINHLEH